MVTTTTTTTTNHHHHFYYTFSPCSSSTSPFATVLATVFTYTVLALFFFVFLFQPKGLGQR